MGRLIRRLLTFAMASLVLASWAESQRPGERPEVKTEIDAPVIFLGQVITPSKDAELSQYVQDVLANLRRSWNKEMPKSPLAGEKGVIYTTFQIDRDGNVNPSDAILEKTYGNVSLSDANDALFSIIRKPGRFDRLPKTVVDPVIRVRVLIFLNSSDSVFRRDARYESDSDATYDAQTVPSPQNSTSSDFQEASVMNRVEPIYPPIAQKARVTGTIVLHETIGSDGSVHRLEYVSGTQLLLKAALDGVRQWWYQPAMLDGRPVDIDATLSVIFTLSP
jgi:TonB family protein